MRWEQLARAVGMYPGEPLVVALSGGADSVLLLHLAASALPRPELRAVHVDHRLRGGESDADVAFCRDLCRSLGVPLVVRPLQLDPAGPSLEARARRARYAVLSAEARRAGARTVVTGHHSDDALETLVQRWTRGTSLTGLAGLKQRRELGRAAGAPRVRVVRPLIGFRREEVRRLLNDRGLAWREDSSNRDLRFTRNRVRHTVLPEIERLCGPEGLHHLREFGRAVEAFEDRLAGATAHLAWTPPAWGAAVRGPLEARRVGALARSALMQLATPLRRRALWRLLVEGTGRAPGRTVLARLLDDLRTARCTRRSLPGGWSLVLRSAELVLLPPRPAASGATPALDAGSDPLLPFPGFASEPARATAAPGSLPLALPGIVDLGDGRRISAELVRPLPGAAPPTGALEVELDAESLPRGGTTLSVRHPRPGDRFHGLGAPGPRRLARFLADCGVPREERGSVLLVLAGPGPDASEPARIVWVAGLRPAEAQRVTDATRHRVRLTLHAPRLDD
jgi:tRNA(Ile)-lysidine synthase